PIPARHLSPNRFPETLIVEAAFPPDDRSLGWEKATTVSRAWDQATTDGALETAAYVSARFAELSGSTSTDRDKAKAFCHKFAERAFRRPLTDEQKRTFIDKQFEAAPDNDAAIKRVVLLVLKSPRFLYREVGGQAGGPDAYDVASRLAYTLWDSPPDTEL